MAVSSLGSLICVLVTLQISYATVDPNYYFIDSRTGLRYLNVDPSKLSEAELIELRDIITYGEDAHKYCKFKAVRPKWNFFYITEVRNWCWKKGPNGEEHYGFACCQDEGSCTCDQNGGYRCYCE